MKKLLLIIPLLLSVCFVFAQASEYTFAQSTQTYTEITGGSVVTTGTSDDVQYAITPPFDFVFGGELVTAMAMSTNGYLSFNAGTSSFGNTAISSSTTGAGVVAAMSRDLKGRSDGEMRWEVFGTAPDRYAVFQWKNWTAYGSSYVDDNWNFQIVIYETTNNIEINYGPFTWTSTYSNTAQVGIRGATNGDFNNRTTTADWSATTAGAANNATCAISTTIYPPNGLQFAYDYPVASTPPNAPVLISPADGGWAFIDATLNWMSGGGLPDTYDVYLDTVDGSTLVSDDQLGTSYAPTLAAGTTYYWKVVAANSFGDGPASDVWSFTTPTTTQLAESFENTTFPPPGWANGTSGNWTRSTSSPVYHGVAKAYKFTSTTTAYQLSTPMVTITASSTLDFWTYATNTSQVLQIVYSPDRVTWTQVGSDITYAASYTYYNQVVDLSSLAGNNYYLAFQTPILTSTGSVYVDYVFGPEITPLAPGAPSLTAPADLATDVNEFTTFSWNAPTMGGVPTGYNLYLDTEDGTTLYASNVTSPYTVSTALAYNTTHYWTVEAYNGAGTGPAATVRSFTTRVDPTITTFPWEVDFGTTTAEWPVPNWSQLTGLYGATPSAGTQWYQDDWLNVTTPANKAAKINIYGTMRYGWLVTPPLQVPAGDYELKFDLALMTWNSQSTPVTSGNQPDDRFLVVYDDNPMMSSPTILREWNNTGSSHVFDDIDPEGETATIALTGISGIKYFAFYGESTVSNGDNDLMVDNVTVRETPAAPIFSYDPTSIDFGMVVNGVQTGPQNVTITNDGGGTLNIAAADISISGTNAAEFSFETTNLPAALGAGESVIIPVYVTGTTDGAISATLTIVNTQTRTNYDVALAANVLPAGIVTVGDGTVANPIPINAHYGYTYSQSIYLQSELNMADQRIEKVWFYWNGTAECISSNDWVVYMGHTASAEFASTSDWLPLANLSQVFAGEVALPATAGWIEITLASPFVYNNTDNLVVAVEENEGGYDYPYGNFYSTVSTTNRSLYYYSDGTNPDPGSPPAGTLLSAYSNLMLQFGDIPMEPPDPVVLTYPADTATGLPIGGFDLTWAPALTGGVPTNYGVYIASTAGTIYDENYFETTNTHFDPVADGGMTFSYDERWYWTVYAWNAYGDAIVDPPYSFEIQSDPRIDLPHAEDFGTDATPVWPANWTQTSTGSNVWACTATANAGGTANEMTASWTSLLGTTRLITPPINTDGISLFTASFNTYFNDFGAGITAKVQYSHDLATWYDTGWSITSGGGDVTGYKTVLISGLVDQPTTYVAWVLDGDHFQFDYWYVDDVALNLPPDHDVAPISWDFPDEVVPENTLVTPMATVINNGVNTETFDVTCTIGSYTSTATVTDLALGQTQQVSFTPFTPALWSADLVEITTGLTTDEVTQNDTLFAALICLDLDTPGLANNAQTDQFVQFNLADPGTLDALPNGYTGSFFMSGADWMNGSWMAVEYDDGTLTTDNYYEIDPLTGIYAPSLGEPGAAIMGIAYDDTNDILYGVGGTDATLYTMDTATGLATAVAVMWYNLDGTPTSLADIGGLMIACAYDNLGGILYGVDLGNDCLWVIDPVTAELTLVGFFGIDLNYAQDAAFDQENGLLFLAGYAGGGALYWVDTTYGGAYKIGPFGTGAYELDGFAIPYGTLTIPDPAIDAAGSLTWPEVTGAVQYKVLKATDPYGTYVPYATVYGTTWTDPLFTEDMAFYQIVAVGGRLSEEHAEIHFTEPLRKAGKLGQKNRVETGIAGMNK